MALRPIPEGYTSVARYPCPLKDPFGHHGLVASRVEDLSAEEIEERRQALFARGHE